MLKSNNIHAITPYWNGYYKPSAGYANVDLGGGVVRIEYIFGEVKESEHIKYYKRNQSTNACEIRINGRVIKQNEFKNIWGIENHPHYNHFLCIINLISDDISRLPKTKTNKSGILLGDVIYENLCKWIRTIFPIPPRSLSCAVNEKELVDKLKWLKETHLTTNLATVEREFSVYSNIGCPVKVDLYVFDSYKVWLYEAKKDTAEAINVYQLRMYWDGAVSDGIKPDVGVLIASKFPEGVKKLVNELNNSLDSKGNKYNIIMREWEEEGVDYKK